MIKFSTYCKLHGNTEIKKSYIQSLKILANHVHEHTNICNTFIGALEQANEDILSENDFNEIINIIKQRLDRFYYRQMPDGSTIWTTVWRLQKPIFFQFQCSSERFTEKILSMVMTLAILANDELILKTINELSDIKEDSITFWVFKQNEFEEKIMKLPEDSMTQETPVEFFGSTESFADEQPEIGIIIHNSYDIYSDWSIYPENKAIIWLLMRVFSLSVMNLTHMNTDAMLARKSREFCETIFGDTIENEMETQNNMSSFKIDIQLLMKNANDINSKV
jgi:hypothetical protein